MSHAHIALIAAVDMDYGLGYRNQLLCHLPADLQHFKALTLGKTIVMGRKTYESIGRPLPYRHNIVLSRQSLDIPGVRVLPSIAACFAEIPSDEVIMVIGGAQLYQAFLPHAQTLYLTHIQHRFTADVFFPACDLALWRCVQKTLRSRDDKNSYDMQFAQYERIL